MGKARRDKATMAALTRKVSAITAGRDTPTATRRRPQRIDATLKAAIRRDERSHYALAEAAGITSQQIGRFMLDDDDERHRGISLETAASLAVVLGLELRPCGT